MEGRSGGGLEGWWVCVTLIYNAKPRDTLDELRHPLFVNENCESMIPLYMILALIHVASLCFIVCFTRNPLCCGALFKLR